MNRIKNKNKNTGKNQKKLKLKKRKQVNINLEAKGWVMPAERNINQDKKRCREGKWSRSLN